jgi:hypothetical protein
MEAKLRTGRVTSQHDPRAHRPSQRSHEASARHDMRPLSFRRQPKAAAKSLHEDDVIVRPISHCKRRRVSVASCWPPAHRCRDDGVEARTPS